MNLRQKVKKAKEELEIIEKTHPENTTWDIVEKFRKKEKLQKIINYKRNFNRYYHWNEKHEINWDRLTYISFSGDYTELGVLKSANGKPLKSIEVNNFLNLVFRTKFHDMAKKVATEELSKNKTRKHVDYFLTVSNDRTKGKKLHVEKIYYQFRGEDKLYTYNKNNGK